MRKKIDEEPQYTGDFLSLTRWRKLASHKVWYYVLAGVFGFSLIAYFGPGQYGGGRGASKASPSKDDSSGDVIAIVNDVPVSRVSYENQWSQMQNQMGGALAGQPTMAANFQGSVLSQLVNDAIARSAAKKKNLSVSEADIDKELQKLKESISGPGKPVDEAQFQAMLDARGVTESQVRDDLRESLLPRILADSISNQQKVTEDDVLKSYDEVKVRRIFVGVISPTSAMPGSLPDAQAQRRMEQIQAKIKGGEDFAKAADQYSTDPGNKNSVTDPKTKKSTITLLGGQLNAGQGVQKEDIGWYKRGGGQGDEFDNAAFALKKGEMSGIIKSPAGYNLIKVEDTRRKLPTDYDKKKADYLKQLKESKARKPITDMMEAEKKAAKIVWKDPMFEWRYRYGQIGGFMGGGTATPADKQKLLADLRAYAPKHPEDSAASLVLNTMLKEEYTKGAIHLPGDKTPAPSEADRAKIRTEMITNFENALNKAEDREARFDLANLYRENKQDDKAIAQYLEIKKLLAYDDNTSDKLVHQRLAIQFRQMNRTDLATAEDTKIAELTVKEAKEKAERDAEQKKNAPVTKVPGGTINVMPNGKPTNVVVPPPAPAGTKAPTKK